MARYIIRLKEDKYCEWSTVVDAPISPVLSKRGILQYMLDVCGNNKADAAERLCRADMDRQGTTSEDIDGSNRAGDYGASLSLEEIVKKYEKKKTP